MTAKLELYRVFREVAETGNISAAAQNLYISQSAVSQSVKQLEGALQTRLFIRSPRGVTLTDDGQMLFEHVRSAMGLLETGEEKLAQTRALQMGKLVIGASDTVTSQFLLPHLDSFHKKYPNIHIQIISGRSHKVLGLLRSGKVDVAFASSPSEDEGLSCVPCFATHSCFVAAADYPCDFERAYSMQELAALPLILLERKMGTIASRTSVLQTQKITYDEICRAACCNLAESFETNPSVDVSYSDAATGARQIKLLGLAGTYVQMLTENYPNFRGAASLYGGLVIAN